jgi:hypothetical protein
VADREMANALCQLGSRERPVVISSLGKTPLLHLYGGIRGVGSYYWENAIGLRDWADFFGTTSFELAKDIAQRRGIDWILLSDREDFTKMTLRIRNSKPDDAGSTIAARLKQDPALLPAWIQPLGTPTVTLGPKAKATFRVFQIKFDKR